MFASKKQLPMVFLFLLFILIKLTEVFAYSQ